MIQITRFFPLTQPLPRGGEESDDTGHAPSNPVRLAAREFRYHSGRARYLMRDRDPESLAPTSQPAEGEWGGGVDPAYGVWTDYDGDTVYGDYRLESDNEEPPTLTPERLNDYMPGSYTTTTVPPFPTTQPVEITEWYHTDQVGSTRVMTSEPAGEPEVPGVVRRPVYTAFGEPVNPPVVVLPGGNRYGYCGAWGYETHVGGSHEGSLWGDSFDPAPGLVHVGARWYEPATGRFIQRDPIGIRGGLNVYEYVENDPIQSVDPRGKDRWIVTGGIFHHDYVIVQNTKGLFNGVKYLRIEFWGRKNTGWLFDDGVVDVKPYRDALLGTCISSTIEEDSALIDKALADDKNPPGYNTLLYNCQHYARYISRFGTNPLRWFDMKHH